MRRTAHPRGFTIVLAIALLAMIAVATAMIAHQLGYELRRTRTAYEDAQLRQLLLAGAQDVASHSTDSTTKTGQVELPPTLASQGASLSISQPKSGGDVLILARLGTREANQTLHFDEPSHRWALAKPTE